ncbi:MAG: hypothetical protein PF505_14815, partial [Vallitaleaceae bacterium]|nr:hypothetical protein [Vallitaleaceae bacterium]
MKRIKKNPHIKKIIRPLRAKLYIESLLHALGIAILIGASAYLIIGLVSLFYPVVYKNQWLFILIIGMLVTSVV